MSEFRKDPLTETWVILSEERAQRPYDFQRHGSTVRDDRECPFCPGHEHLTPPEILSYKNAKGGWQLRVVPNKYPAVSLDGGAVGVHEVIIETPQHVTLMSDVSEESFVLLFRAFRDRVLALKDDPRCRYILLFKNHGPSAGASLEHPHSQLISLPLVPERVQQELRGARDFLDRTGLCAFCEMARNAGDRYIFENDDITAFAPYAPRFAFETWVFPKQHASHFELSNERTIENLGRSVHALLRRLERVAEHPPFNFLLHTAPHSEPPLAHYHWHLELIPRLANVAGFEWGTGYYINHTPPERSAELLRNA